MTMGCMRIAAAATLAVAVADSWASQAIPFKRDVDTTAGSIAGGGIGIIVISLLAIGAVLVLRKRLKLGLPVAGAAPLVKVLESQRLGPRSVLTVVEFGGSQHLIAQGEHGITYLVAGPATAPAVAEQA